jgi:hypothetical protein
LKQYIKDVTQLQKQLYQISETKVKIATQKNSSLEDDTDKALDSMWRVIDKNVTSMMPFVNDTVERWNVRNQGSNILQNQKSKVFNKGIV